MYKFDITEQNKSIIKVIGVGGGGSNAINHMYNRGIKDVEFVVCNTDAQALKSSPVPLKLQIGIDLTAGLGAGANPEKGRDAALESKEDIRELLSDDTKMIFITAGMGGGTGTGAAPVIAQIATELHILTVGIVTAPFFFEGKKKIQQANEGIKELRKHCDTVLVVSNDKLREVFGNMLMTEAYAQADNILATAAKSIAELITVEAYVNVDFEDVKTVMKKSGTAVMGSAKAEGEDRALVAVEEALSSPLLDNKDIKGAKKILLSVMSGDKAEIQMDEFGLITNYLHEQAENADMIFGQGIDTSLGEAIQVTVIVTGFDANLDDDNDPNASEKTNSEDTQEENIVEKKNLETKPKKNSNSIQKVVEDFSTTDTETKEEISIVYKTLPKEPKKVEKEIKENVISDLELKKIKLENQAEERAKKLRKLSTNYIEDDAQEIKEKIDVPAYLRKNIKLKEVPHSSAKKLSKLNLNEDNEILGDNKFFFDQPD